MRTFKNIYYDSWKNKMYLWEYDSDTDRTEMKEFDHEIEYYVLDKSGKSSIKSIYGDPVIRRVTKSKDKLKELKESGEKLFESDLSEEVKFLHKRYDPEEDLLVDYNKFVIANIDIEIQTEGVFPKPEEALFPINLVTIQLLRTGEIYTLGLNPYTGNKLDKSVNYLHCKSEEQLIQNLCKILKHKKVTSITGWNTSGDLGGFDIPYIVNRIERLNLDCSLSPMNKHIKKYNGDIEIPGIADFDLLKLYKKYTYVNQPSYSLNYIGLLEVNEGKLDTEGSIQDLWKRDWNLFVEYNIQDVLLVSKIEKKKKLIEQAINFYTLTRTPPNKVCSTVAVAEGYIKKFLMRRNLVIPNRKEITSNEKIKGAFVSAIPGFYLYSINIDATSLYPSLMRQFNISPETQRLYPKDIEGLIKTNMDGLYYIKEQGIIPEIVTEMFNLRKYHKELASKYELEGDVEKFEYHDSQQLIYKIFINSIYGAFLEKSFHFFDINNGSCITSMGREIIQYVAKNVNNFLINEFPTFAKQHYPNFKNSITKKNKISVIDTDSVAGSSLINTDSGDIKIEDIFDNYSYNKQEKSQDNFIASVDNLKTLSFNKDTKKSEYKDIKYIKKHKVKKRLFKVKHMNDEVIVTEDHSIIIERNGKYLDISVKDLIKGDKIIKSSLIHSNDFEIKDLGIQEEWVYDIEVDNNHNFFANNILVHNSNYINLEEIFISCNTGLDFLHFTLDFEEKILQPFLNKIMKEFAEKYDTENLIQFKREKIILKQYVQCKKKYITQIIANEKKIYKEPIVKITGIELNKSDLCKFSKDSLGKLCEIMFQGERPNKQNMLNHIRQAFNEFKTHNINEISTPKGVKDYDAYSIELDQSYSNFKPHTPIHNRASIIYNQTIKDNNLPYMEIFNGTKLKYIYTKENNKYKSNIIGFIGNYPKEFESIFTIDYEEQFNTQYLNIAQRFFDTLGFGQVTLKDSKLLRLIEEE